MKLILALIFALTTTVAQANYNQNPLLIIKGGTGIATLPSAGQMLIGNAGGTAYALALMSGDASMAASGVLTIASSAISNSKMANMAAHTYKGNNTAGSAAPIDVTSAQLTADLGLFSSTLQGMAPASGGGAVNFLRADGTWATPAGSSYSAGTGLTLTGSVFSITAPVSVALGGTNSAAALNNNRVMQSSGGAIVEAAAIAASKALASDVNGIPVASATTATELGYVSGVTSAIQTQLNGKSPLKYSITNGGDTAYAILSTDMHIRDTTALTAQRAYTLPACTGSNPGERHEVKNLATQTFNIVLTAAGSDTIDGASTYVLEPGDSVPVICAAFSAAGTWDVQ